VRAFDLPDGLLDEIGLVYNTRTPLLLHKNMLQLLVLRLQAQHSRPQLLDLGLQLIVQDEQRVDLIIARLPSQVNMGDS